jgi:hypothetical protein
MPTLRTTLDALEANSRHLARWAIVADREIRRSMSEADGYPASTSTSRERGGGELTSVEAAADRRIAIGDRRSTELRQLLEQAEQVTGQLVALVNRWLPSPDRGSAERCSGGGSLPGSLDWGRPECTNIASRRGLCDACYMRMSRWQRPGGDAA